MQSNDAWAPQVVESGGKFYLYTPISVEGWPKNVIAVAVADNPREVSDFLKDRAIALPVVDDRRELVSRSWDARVLPTTVILDRRHRIRMRGQGPVDWDSHAVREQLQPFLNAN